MFVLKREAISTIAFFLSNVGVHLAGESCRYQLVGRGQKKKLVDSIPSLGAG